MNGLADPQRHETRAAVAMESGDFGIALTQYEHAQAAWLAKADHAARYGETLLSDHFKSEAEKNAIRANRAYNRMVFA